MIEHGDPGDYPLTNKPPINNLPTLKGERVLIRQLINSDIGEN